MKTYAAIALLSGMAVPAGAAPIALDHVRLFAGGGAPVEDATVLIDGDHVVAAGRAVPVPPTAERRDYRGYTVMPGLISDHSHVGAVSGVSTGPQNYTAEIIAGQLAQYRRYGVTTVVALGNNRPLFDSLRVQAHAGRLPADLFGVDQGIGAPDGAPPQAMMKSAPDQLYRPATVAEAKAAVDRMVAAKTDLVKIWVDTFGGTLPRKMRPEIVAAVIAQAHARGVRVAAHIHDLADARMVVAAGADILAHGVRDQPIPPEFAGELKTRGVWYVATLELDEATTAWAEQAPWTRTAFARAALSPELARQVDDPAWRARTLADPKAAEARTSLAMNLRNLKILHDAGVRIGFGTDSGAAPLRVPGIAEHRELALMVEAGLSPVEALTVATSRAAEEMGLADRGTIAAGRRADLLVVRGDPTRNIAAIDDIVESWSAGTVVKGPLPAPEHALRD
ncbi:amidohydrolase family protein [Sphingomonas profundi]|uniref:amidohydrolase family protein n=1 Tax=Alterirhizorhabdus profundi TaxID=2681549 RepID=UPI0012E72E58|nr:amidohydrolase family protein [Sphingomonas profundi]